MDRVLAMSGLRSPASVALPVNYHGSEEGCPASSPRRALASFVPAFPTSAEQQRHSIRSPSSETLAATVALEIQLRIAQEQRMTRELELKLAMLAPLNSTSPPRHRKEPASKVEPVGVVL